MSAAVMNIEASDRPDGWVTHTPGVAFVADGRYIGSIDVDISTATVLARGVAVYHFARVAGQLELEPHAVRLGAFAGVIPVVATSGVGVVTLVPAVVEFHPLVVVLHAFRC